MIVLERDVQAGGPDAERLAEVASELRAEGAQLRGLSLEDRIDALARWAASWLEPSGDCRGRALEQLSETTGLSRASLAWGLDRSFEGVTQQTLARWWERDSKGADPLGLSGHLWAGNVATAGLPPVVASLLAGAPALVKTPAALAPLGPLLVDSLRSVSPVLGSCLAALSWGRSEIEITRAFLASVDVLYAFGEDASLDQVSSLAPAGLRVARFGHRYSVGLITAEAVQSVGPAELVELALDVLAWDGEGCLTPRWVFVEGDFDAAVHLATEAAGALPEVALQLPPGRTSAGAGAERAAWLARAAVEAWVRSGPGWACAAVPGPFALPAPPGRTLCFVPLDSLEGLPSLLEPLGPRLQGVALVAEEGREPFLEELLAPLGVSLTVAPGLLQAPPLDWDHDDVRILATLFG